MIDKSIKFCKGANCTAKDDCYRYVKGRDYKFYRDGVMWLNGVSWDEGLSWCKYFFRFGEEKP